MSLKSSEETELPFNEEFQMSIIGHGLRDQHFFINCNNMLKPEWFTKNVMLSNIFSQMKKSYTEYGFAPRSAAELLNEKFFLLQSPNDYTKYKELLDRCDYLASSNRSFDIEKIKRNLTKFIKVCKFKEAVEGGVQKFKTYGLDEAYGWTSKKLTEISEANFEADTNIMSFDNPREWLYDEAVNKDHAISTGCRKLDHALGGGLFKGETSALMAPSNFGKSRHLITILRHALKQGLNVLYTSHEDNPKKLRRQIFQAVLGVTKNKLLNPEMIKNNDFKKDFDAVSLMLRDQLVYLPYSNLSGMYIEDLAREIEKRHREMINKTGRGFDIIIDDYPKKLRTKNRNSDAYRNELAQVYDVFNQIAIALNVHCYVAIQTNREGLKRNNGTVKADYLLGMESVDESYGIVQNMGNIITLNRTPEDKRLDIIRYSIAKSRNDMTDITVNTRAAYGASLTHGDKDMFDGRIKFHISSASTYFERKMVEHRLSITPDLGNVPYLASYGQNHNALTPSIEVDKILRMLENGEVSDDEDYKYFKEHYNTMIKKV